MRFGNHEEVVIGNLALTELAAMVPYMEYMGLMARLGGGRKTGADEVRKCMEDLIAVKALIMRRGRWEGVAGGPRLKMLSEGAHPQVMGGYDKKWGLTLVGRMKFVKGLTPGLALLRAGIERLDKKLPERGQTEEGKRLFRRFWEEMRVAAVYGGDNFPPEYLRWVGTAFPEIFKTLADMKVFLRKVEEITRGIAVSRKVTKRLVEKTMGV